MTDPPFDSSAPPRPPTALVRWSWRLIKDVLDEYREDGVGVVRQLPSVTDRAQSLRSHLEARRVGEAADDG